MKLTPRMQPLKLDWSDQTLPIHKGLKTLDIDQMEDVYKRQPIVAVGLRHHKRRGAGFRSGLKIGTKAIFRELI